MKVDVVAEAVKSRYVPDENTLSACRTLGETVGVRISGNPTTAPNNG
jgi:hypothetical protein